METVTLIINTNADILEIIDKSFNDILVHKFNPHPSNEWWQISLNHKSTYPLLNISLDNILVRNMEFDLQTNLDGLKSIINLNENFICIYQFNKPIPNSLIIEYLPKANTDKILRENGLQHIYWLNYEFLTVESFDKDFIENIKQNPRLVKR